MIKFTLTVDKKNLADGKKMVHEWEWSSLGEDDGSVAHGKKTLPPSFRDPAAFRGELEQPGTAVPRLPFPAAPVYLALTAAAVWWCWFGYTYCRKHPSTSTFEFILFLLGFLVPAGVMAVFHEFHRNIRLHKLFARLAAKRPGAFIAMEKKAPVLYYATERWIGRMDCRVGAEGSEAYTRLDARLRDPAGKIDLLRKTLVAKLLCGRDKYAVSLPDSEFTRKFFVTSPDPEYAAKFLNSMAVEAMMRLAKLGGVKANVNRSSVRVEVGSCLVRPCRTAKLDAFLADAEIIIGLAAGENPRYSRPYGIDSGEMRAGRFAKFLTWCAAAVIAVFCVLAYCKWSYRRAFETRARELTRAEPPDRNDRQSRRKTSSACRRLCENTCGSPV